MFVSLCAIAALLSVARATSSGEDIGVCDADGDMWGCAAGYDKDRRGNLLKLQCKEKEGRLMHWATAPERSDDYKLWVGDEASPTTKYTPGKLHTISLRVTKHRRVYRGLLLYAVNPQGERVGTWELPPDEPQLFQVTSEGQSCPNSVMHTSAEHKPYLVQFKWRAPPPSAGKVSFPALIKYGDANDGDFYWPSAPVELTPGQPAPKAAIEWVRAELGDSCKSACAKRERLCDASKFAMLNSAAELEAQIGDEHACKLPMLRGCTSVGPTSSEDAFCYYHNPDLCDNAPAIDCDAKSDSTHYGRRFCPCVETDGPIPDPSTDDKSGMGAAGGMDAQSIYKPIDCTPGESACSCDADMNCALATDECLQGTVCVRKNCVGEKGCPCSKGRCLSGGAEELECALIEEGGQDGICQIATASINEEGVGAANSLAAVQLLALAAAAMALLVQ